MSYRTHIYAAILGFFLISAQATGQEQVDPIQKLIQQYESMSDKERVSFLQAIALIGLQKASSAQPAIPPTKPTTTPTTITPPLTVTPPPPTTPQPEPTPTQPPQAPANLEAPAHTPALAPSTSLPPTPSEATPPDKPVTTVQITLPEPTEPQPDADIQAAVAPAPAKLLVMPQTTPTANSPATTAEPVAPVAVTTAPLASTLPTQVSEPAIEQPATIPVGTKAIRVIASQQMDYGFTGSNNPSNSVFGLLLPEYQQKLNNSGAKIEIDDLRKETINFYVTSLEGKISDCGYQIVKSNDAASVKDTPLKLETAIQRIVINKTLFETALIGEANAKVTNNQQELSSIQTRSTKALPQFDNLSQRSSELKNSLSQTIEQLSNQVASKICSLKIN